MYTRMPCDIRLSDPAWPSTVQALHLNEREDDAIDFMTGLERLVAMGYKEDAAEEALVVGCNSVVKALEYLATR